MTLWDSSYEIILSLVIHCKFPYEGFAFGWCIEVDFALLCLKIFFIYLRRRERECTQSSEREHKSRGGESRLCAEQGAPHGTRSHDPGI